MMNCYCNALDLSLAKNSWQILPTIGYMHMCNLIWVEHGQLHQKKDILLFVYVCVCVCVNLWNAICVKTQDDAGIYDSCWYLRQMLVFTLHAGTINTSMKCKYQHEP